MLTTPSIRWIAVLLTILIQTSAHSLASDGPGDARLLPRIKQSDSAWTVEIAKGDRRFGTSGLELRLQGEEAFVNVTFHETQDRGRVTVLGPTTVGALSLCMEYESLAPELLRQTLVVKASRATKFAARFSLSVAIEGTYSTFSGSEPSHVVCDTLGGAPESPSVRGEMFPVAMVRSSDLVIGLLGDSPGSWENRCQVELDPAGHQLAVLCGDGSDERELRIVNDARDAYVGKVDGWQSLRGGEERRFDTWIFTSPAHSHYDAQLAAHLALSNAKGWNGSAVEAILRNTAYLNLRRNLLREGKEPGRYIFISGVGYGWKQWVSDGFWQAVALDDPEMLAESQASVFLNRITYEDNAQYYLIWTVLAKRAGREPNAKLVREAFDFIRRNEKDGIFYPPPLPGVPKPKGWKTYMDLLEYDDDDAPVSNQGFHCGALMAAQELGLPITTADLDRATAGYRGMFNANGGYFPTSIKQPGHVGQDALYGAALTYAVFGKKILADEQVLTHWRTSQRIATPYGLRVISQADGSLLPGHSGEYVFGGSWFLIDAANHLMAELHGLPAAEANDALIKRIATELAVAPAFNESISTLSGKPHGHVNYSWNAGYWWLRKQFRQQLGQTGPDPVATEIDRRLGVIRDQEGLRLLSKLTK